MKYSWVTFVVLGIWACAATIVVGRPSTSAGEIFLFATVATVVISFMGFYFS